MRLTTQPMIVRHRKDVQRVLITILMPIQGDGATAAINIITNFERGVAAMDALDEHDYLIDGDAVTVHRDRAREMLNEIARQTKQALAEHRIDLSVFFLVPSSGDAVITFGCSGDPDDELWSRVAAIVSAIVGRSVGLAGRDADQLRVPQPPIWSLITSPGIFCPAD